MTITVYEGTKKHELPFNEGETILTVLQNAGIQSITAPCGGKGACKKCIVNAHVGEEGGPVLSCTTPAKDGMVVEFYPEDRFSFADRFAGRVFPPDAGLKGYGIACDIGTTKVVCQLVSLETGELVCAVSGSNNQRIFGGDVLSRLVAAEEGHADEIHEQIILQINEFIGQLCRQADITSGDIRILAAAGNTIMMHFFAGLNPAQISTAPFTPVSLFGEMKKSQELGLAFDGDVYLCPSVSGFIGSDVLCGILTGSMAEGEDSMLLIDLGANTEMVMGNRDGMIACTVDGGAALKGSLLDHGMIAGLGAVSGARFRDGEMILDVLGAGKPTGICGSGFIDILGILYEQEILDEMGRIAAADETDSPLASHIGEEEGRTVFYVTKDKKIYISQADISKFQMAKAAIYAGIRVLSEETGIPVSRISRLLLSGGMGSFVHRKNAALLGMIPRECMDNSVKLGNTALAGAVSAVLSEKARAGLSRIQGMVKVIDLPTHPSFSDEFTDGMIFE